MQINNDLNNISSQFNNDVKEWSFSKKATLLITGVGITLAGGAVAAVLTFKAVLIIGGLGAIIGIIVTVVALYHLFGFHQSISFSKNQLEAIKQEIIPKFDSGESIDDLIVAFNKDHSDSNDKLERNKICFLKSILKNYSPKIKTVYKAPVIDFQLEEDGKKLLGDWLESDLLAPPVDKNKTVKVDYGNCKKEETFPQIFGVYNPDHKATKVYVDCTTEDAIIFFGGFEKKGKLQEQFPMLTDKTLEGMGYDKQYNLLSNYHDKEITIGKQTYKTREHALQSMKFNNYFMDQDLEIRGIGTIKAGENVRDFLANLQCEPNDIRKAAGAIQKHLSKKFPDNQWMNFVNVDDLDRTIREQRIIIFHAFFNKDGTVNKNGIDLYSKVGDKYLYEGNYRRNITQRSDRKYGAEFTLDNDGNNFTLVGHNILGRVSREACNLIGKIPKNNNNN